MRKKNIKTKSNKRLPQKSSSHNQIFSLLNNKYFPYLVLFSIAFVYFSPSLLSESTMYTTDDAYQGSGSKENRLTISLILSSSK